MGRKPAPLPLTLSDTTAPGDDQTCQRPGAGETVHIASPLSPLSPVESRSPRSPRSPFRFHHKKSPELGNSLSHQSGSQPLHANDIPRRPQDDHLYPPISSALEPHQPYERQSATTTSSPATTTSGTNELQAHDHGLGLGQGLGQGHGHSHHHYHHQQHHQQSQSQSQHQNQNQNQNQSRNQHYHYQSQSQNHLHQTEDKASKSGFFFNFKSSMSSKSTDRLHPQQSVDSRSDAMSRGADQSSMTKQGSKHSEQSYADSHIQKPIASLPSKSDVSLASSVDFDTNPGSSKKGKPKPFTLLSRSRSTRDNKDSPSPKDSRDGKDGKESAPPVRLVEPERAYTAHPLRTAPGPPERSFRDMMSSAVRNHSADRAYPRDVPGRDKEHSRDRDHLRTQPSSFRENGSGGGGGGGGGFFGGLKNSSSRAADMISKGLFGKSARSGSTTEREPVVDDEHYQLRVLNLPLVDQVRLTRISKRLEDSRDKTEFWMPAFPWRAIDYLNYKGTEVEGLYRVPGSGPQIKKWQRKFDEEYDVDLFAQDDLYDINIIGSMLKAWLRQLPDELFPKEAQERVARECVGAETVPQLLIDELSNLSPFNYYLLFAITCHLSLLLAHSDKNKMDFRNLCICFQPCMKIDAFCFKFLVCDWRDCWKGCKDEAKFIEEEYMLFDQPPPRGLHDTTGSATAASSSTTRKAVNNSHEGGPEDRNVSSSDSSKQSTQSDQQKGRLKKKAAQPENGSVASNNSTISTTLTIDSQRETPPRRSGDMRPLSPIKPLSPLGF